MKRRIIISLGLLLVLTVFGSVMAMFLLRGSIQSLTALVESHRIQTMRVSLKAGSVNLETELLARMAGHEHEPEELEDHVERFRASLSSCKKCHHPLHPQKGLEQIGDRLKDYQVATSELFAAGDSPDREAREIAALAVASDIVERTTEMADRAGNHLRVRGADVEAGIRRAWIVLSATLAVVLMVGGVVAFHLKRRLTGPVEGLLAGIERVRRGDLTHRILIDADEEFQALAQAFNEAYGELRKASESMLQAEKLAAVGKLAAGVAHEVINPLASISSIAQMMRRKCTSERQAEQLDLIMSEIARISHIVREMLSFSKPAPVEKLEGHARIPGLLERASNLAGYDPRARGVEIIRSFEADVPVVRGDAERLLLVFTNIIINALDAIHTNGNGDGTLTISARRREGCVVIQFADDGSGMSDEALKKAFEPFFTTKEPGAGTGLGLWICEQVVHRHGGAIFMESRIGQGTTVTIELPCGLDEVEADKDRVS